MARESRSNPKKRPKGIKPFIVPGIITIILFGTLGVFVAMQPRQVGGTPFTDLSPEEQAKRREEAQALDKQISDIAQASKNKEKKPFTLTATEEQLNTMLQDRLKTQNLPVNNLRLGLQSNEIVLQGDANYKGFNAPATLSGTLEARDGAATFKVNSLKVGAFPAPDDWGQKVESKVSKALDDALRSGKNGRIEKIEIEQGRMTVSGVTG